MRNRRLHFQFAVIGFTLIGATGCATAGQSAAAGGAAGAAAGAGVGLLADPGRHGDYRIRNVLLGSAVGAAIGVGGGLLIGNAVNNAHQNGEAEGKQSAKAEAEDHAAETSGRTPKLIPAKTEAQWVPDQVHGSTFVPGHFEYKILENAHWEVTP